MESKRVIVKKKKKKKKQKRESYSEVQFLYTTGNKLVLI